MADIEKLESRDLVIVKPERRDLISVTTLPEPTIKKTLLGPMPARRGLITGPISFVADNELNKTVWNYEMYSMDPEEAFDQVNKSGMNRGNFNEDGAAQHYGNTAEQLRQGYQEMGKEPPEKLGFGI